MQIDCHYVHFVFITADKLMRAFCNRRTHCGEYSALSAVEVVCATVHSVRGGRRADSGCTLNIEAHSQKRQSIDK